MTQYIRAFIPIATFFFTVTLLERRRKLLTENIDNLREVFKAARRRRPLTADWPYSTCIDTWNAVFNPRMGGRR
jgi:REP element-mobilizing transposase RayT